MRRHCRGNCWLQKKNKRFENDAKRSFTTRQTTPPPRPCVAGSDRGMEQNERDEKVKAGVGVYVSLATSIPCNKGVAKLAYDFDCVTDQRRPTVTTLPFPEPRDRWFIQNMNTSLLRKSSFSINPWHWLGRANGMWRNFP